MVLARSGRDEATVRRGSLQRPGRRQAGCPVGTVRYGSEIVELGGPAIHRERWMVMSRGSSGHPRMVVDGKSLALSPVPFDGPTTTEDWIQEQLDKNPGLLPIDEISSAWGPLISLGREIPLAVGFVDNLFVSPAGEVTVVEAKLWRNPEARRNVIGQIRTTRLPSLRCRTKTWRRPSSGQGRRISVRSGSAFVR